MQPHIVNGRRKQLPFEGKDRQGKNPFLLSFPVILTPTDKSIVDQFVTIHHCPFSCEEKGDLSRLPLKM